MCVYMQNETKEADKTRKRNERVMRSNIWYGPQFPYKVRAGRRFTSCDGTNTPSKNNNYKILVYSNGKEI